MMIRRLFKRPWMQLVKVIFCNTLMNWTMIKSCCYSVKSDRSTSMPATPCIRHPWSTMVKTTRSKTKRRTKPALARWPSRRTAMMIDREPSPSLLSLQVGLYWTCLKRMASLRSLTRILLLESNWYKRAELRLSSMQEIVWSIAITITTMQGKATVDFHLKSPFSN